jgi:hypothetical protein
VFRPLETCVRVRCTGSSKSYARRGECSVRHEPARRLIDRRQRGRQRTFVSNFAQIATPTATSFNDTGLTPSTSYSYRVRARDAVPNFSAYSATASATTTSTPTQVVAAYAFDERNGSTTADLSGSGLTASIVGATWTTAGQYMNALSSTAAPTTWTWAIRQRCG